MIQPCAVVAAGKSLDAVTRVNLDLWQRKWYDEAQANVDAGRPVVSLLKLTMLTFLLLDALVLATILPSCKHSTPNATSAFKSPSIRWQVEIVD